jgi:hypothetical protein
MKKQDFLEKIAQTKAKIQIAQAEIQQTIQETEFLNEQVASWKNGLKEKFNQTKAESNNEKNNSIKL